MSTRDILRDLAPKIEPTGDGRPGWYFVTCHVSGDDEDSGYTVEATDAADAAAQATAALIADSTIDETTERDEDTNEPLTYTNHVVFCGAEKPAILWMPH
jgi:hypothetical protein